MLTFVTKDIPKRIADYLRREFTTSITIGIRERELVSLTQWITEYKFAKRPRSYHLRDQTLTAAEGAHFFFYKRHLCWFERKGLTSKDVNGNVGEQKPPSEIQFGYLGRNRDFLIDLFRRSTAWDPTQKSETHIFSPSWRDWNHVASQPKRSMDHLILPNQTRIVLEEHLDWFFKSADWFRGNGIPYRTGICLYGPPGTGKTSLVRAIAAKWDLSIYSVDFSNLDDSKLKELVWKVGPGAIILIEDIDTIPSSNLREKEIALEERLRNSKKIEVTLGGLLNAVDGIVDSDGRVFIMTTNHIEKIDPALLRPGRVNLSIKLDYMTPEMFKLGFARFFPAFKFDEDTNWAENISPAFFQSLIFNNLESPNLVLKGVLKKSETETPTMSAGLPSNVFNLREPNIVAQSEKSEG